MQHSQQAVEPQPNYETQMVNHHPQQMQIPVPHSLTYYNQQILENPQVGQPQLVPSYQYVPTGNSNFPPLPIPEGSGWKTVENRKRIRSPEKNNIIYKQAKMSDYWLNSNPIQVKNRFLALPRDNSTDKDNTETGEQNVISSESKPPPVFVEGVGDINPLIVELEKVAKDGYTLKSVNNDLVKIQPNSSQNYTDIIKALKEKETDFHTYKPKQERCFRVVLKGLHSSADTEILKKELSELGHIVDSVSNIKNRITRNPLSMFYINIKTKENNKEIYQITRLMNSIVKFEAPHTKREIPQCAKCQRFGHTKNYCNKPPRCVKCTGNHSTDKCARKVKDTEVKCVNCGDAHPANYRGCLVHKQLQQRLYPALRERTHINQNNTQQPITPQMVQAGISYAQQTCQAKQDQYINYSSHMQKDIPIQQPNDITELKTMMKQLMEQMGTMISLLSTLVSKMA